MRLTDSAVAGGQKGSDAISAPSILQCSSASTRLCLDQPGIVSGAAAVLDELTNLPGAVKVYER